MKEKVERKRSKKSLALMITIVLTMALGITTYAFQEYQYQVKITKGSKLYGVCNTSDEYHTGVWKLSGYVTCVANADKSYQPAASKYWIGKAQARLFVNSGLKKSDVQVTPNQIYNTTRYVWAGSYSGSPYKSNILSFKTYYGDEDDRAQAQYNVSYIINTNGTNKIEASTNYTYKNY